MTPEVPDALIEEIVRHEELSAIPGQVECTWIHMSFALPDEDDQFVCFNCGAAV